MKRVKAYKDGVLHSLMRAEAVTEETRYAYDYRCIEDKCHCRMHWRKAVYAKANTDPRPPTFVKYRSSEHGDSCPRDAYRIMHENIDYVTVRDGQVNVRINFPLGSSMKDRFPLRGYLTQQMKQAAENQKVIKPFPTVGALVKFLEKTFGSIESDAASDVVVNYQGNAVEWGKLFKGSTMYDMLYYRSRNEKHSEEGKVTSPILTIVRPLYEMGRNENNKRRFACEDQIVYIGGKKQTIIPTIVCDDKEPALATKIAEHAKSKTPMIVTARPFHAGENSLSTRYEGQRIRLYVHKLSQVEAVSDRYWKPCYRPAKQLDLFKPSLTG